MPARPDNYIECYTDGTMARQAKNSGGENTVWENLPPEGFGHGVLNRGISVFRGSVHGKSKPKADFPATYLEPTPQKPSNGTVAYAPSEAFDDGGNWMGEEGSGMVVYATSAAFGQIEPDFC